MALKINTLYPSFSSTPAIFLPIPWAPPVTIATLLAIFTRNFNIIRFIISGVDPGFDQGVPDRDRPKLLMVHSSIM